MDLFKAVDVYCERVDASYWSEPLNALSNIGFILIGLFLFHRLKNGNDKWSIFFSVNLVVIGIGSFLFHTHANILSMFADIIPIMIMIIAFFFYSFKNVLGFGRIISVASTVVVAGTGIFLGSLKLSYFSGSEAYFNVLAALCFFCFMLKNQNTPLSRMYLKAALIFIISLIFRSLDSFLCGSFPFGTHFLWHLNNGYLIYYMISISMTNSKLENNKTE